MGFVASVCVLVYNIVLLTDAYTSRGVQVSVSVQEMTNAIFPVISVCNLSPYKKSATLKYLAMKGISLDTNFASAFIVPLNNNSRVGMVTTSLNTTNDVTTVTANQIGDLTMSSTTETLTFSPNNKRRRKRAGKVDYT